MFWDFLPYFLLAFGLSLGLTPIVRRLALQRGVVDMPGGRRINTRPIARLGGMAVFISFWLTIGLVLLIKPGALAFVSQKIVGIDQNLIGVFFGSLVLFIVGCFDDIKGVKPGVKLFSHGLAAVLVVLYGIKIFWVHNPITGIDIVLGNVTYLIVPFWIVLVINVVNWLDGVDGLASGIGLIASVALFALSISSDINQPATALLAIVLAGALAGFLPFNFNPASIFLGDVGSMFVGFMLAIFAIISGGKFATAALILGLPILDALWVVARRLRQGQPPWQADRKHLHHRILDAGLNQKQVVLFLYSVSALFGAVALTSSTRQKFLASFWLVGLMLFIAALLIGLELKRRYEKR